MADILADASNILIEQAKTQLMDSNQWAKRYDLHLSKKDARAIVLVQEQWLKAAGRIELGLKANQR